MEIIQVQEPATPVHVSFWGWGYSVKLHQVSFISIANYTCAKGVVSISLLQIKVVSVDSNYLLFCLPRKQRNYVGRIFISKVRRLSCYHELYKKRRFLISFQHHCVCNTHIYYHGQSRPRALSIKNLPRLIDEFHSKHNLSFRYYYSLVARKSVSSVSDIRYTATEAS